MNAQRITLSVLSALGLLVAGVPALAGELIVELPGADGVTLVGVLQRWEASGEPRRAVDPKAKIDAPAVLARAQHLKDQRWVFRDLPAGRYDLVILTRDRRRVEGFHYPPLKEFDPFLSPRKQAPEEARAWIIKDIAQAKHYENKVAPLYLAGDDKQIRVLVQLVRDLPTSYDAEFGAPVATVRHEIWQYTNWYGGWTRDKKTRVLDRLLLAKSEFQRWTWVWEPALGSIEVGSKPVTVSYPLPARFDAKKARGWFPE